MLYFGTQLVLILKYNLKVLGFLSLVQVTCSSLSTVEMELKQPSGRKPTWVEFSFVAATGASLGFSWECFSGHVWYYRNKHFIVY